VSAGEPRAMLPAVSAALPQVAEGQPGLARPGDKRANRVPARVAGLLFADTHADPEIRCLA
jgi:hypothetical protein